MEAIALPVYEENEAWNVLQQVVDCAEGEAAGLEPGSSPSEAVRQLVGRVLAARAGVFEMESAGGPLEARRAASCLIEPEVGDRVLLARLPDGGVFVLSVLERESESAAKITSEGGLRVDLGEGKFSVAAKGGVDLMSNSDVSICADRLVTHAREGRFSMGKVSFVGKLVDSVIGRLSQRVKSSFRQVDDLDQVRAGQVDYEARDLFKVHGKNTVLTAEELVKADGKQIHIG